MVQGSFRYKLDNRLHVTWECANSSISFRMLAGTETSFISGQQFVDIRIEYCVESDK